MLRRRQRRAARAVPCGGRTFVAGPGSPPGRPPAGPAPPLGAEPLSGRLSQKSTLGFNRPAMVHAVPQRQRPALRRAGPAHRPRVRGAPGPRARPRDGHPFFAPRVVPGECCWRALSSRSRARPVGLLLAWLGCLLASLAADVIPRGGQIADIDPAIAGFSLLACIRGVPHRSDPAGRLPPPSRHVAARGRGQSGAPRLAMAGPRPRAGSPRVLCGAALALSPVVNARRIPAF